MTQSRRIGTPVRIITAAVLCGLLAVPMLASAGSLAAHATTGDGLASVLSALLTVAVLAIAAVNVLGAVHLVQRGSPRLAQVGAYLTIGITAVMLAAALIGSSATVAVTMGLVFLVPAVVMLTLLGTRRAKRWLVARSRTVRRAFRDRSVLDT
ncbi:MAG: hypothetical protein ACRDUA_16705 [Micromonosporaceae bacterium]